LRVDALKRFLLNALRFKRTPSRPGSRKTTAGGARRFLWLWPVVTASAIAGVAWWIRATVEEAIRQQMTDGIVATHNADIAALHAWMKGNRNDARLLASSEPLLPLVRELLDLEANSPQLEQALFQARAEQALRDYLQPRLRALGYDDFFIVSPRSRVLASTLDATLGKSLEGYRKEFYQQVLTGGPMVSKPHRSPLLLADEKGELKAGLPTMKAAAPVLDENGKPIAVLALRIRPEGSFTEILHVARLGESGETYAFDRNGLLLSQCRFDEELKRVGLLADQPDAKSILTVEVRDPQVNMVTGARPSLKRSEQPLTPLIAQAIDGRGGVDARGHRDYRGVPSVGASTWLPEYDFGVATEIDLDEAYRPLYALHLAFWILMAVLGVGAAAVLLLTILVARQQRLMREAVLQAKQLGQYRLEDKIGAGGMGSVYKARHALLRRATAVKLLEPAKMSDLAIARFEREVQLTSQLTHPNTVAIFDFGRTPEGVFFYAMEYLDGINLEDLVARVGPLPAGRVVAILRQVCGSLAEAHALGLIHRDIKPANIMLTNRGGIADFVKVLDFGLARGVGNERDVRLTSAGDLTGTPLYLAPEAIERPNAVDARTDLYAVGAVGYWLLTGKPVFEGDSILDLCRKHLGEAPAPPSRRIGRAIDPILEALILQCLEKDAARRPRTATALATELARCDDASAGWQDQAEQWWRDFKAAKGDAAVLTPNATVDAQTVSLHGVNR
jgi:eukaryotic-like serine/threonine-protein kinase